MYITQVKGRWLSDSNTSVWCISFTLQRAAGNYPDIPVTYSVLYFRIINKHHPKESKSSAGSKKGNFGLSKKHLLIQEPYHWLQVSGRRLAWGTSQRIQSHCSDVHACRTPTTSRGRAVCDSRQDVTMHRDVRVSAVRRASSSSHFIGMESVFSLSEWSQSSRIYLQAQLSNRTHHLIISKDLSRCKILSHQDKSPSKSARKRSGASKN